MDLRTVVVVALGSLLACNDSSATSGTTSTGSTSADASSSGSPLADTSGSTSPGTESGGAFESTSGDASSSTGEPPWEGLQAGVAVRYLDRPVGISMAGYGGRVGGVPTPWNGIFAGSRGFFALPTMKAIVLDSGGERLVLLKTPLMSGESGVTDALIAKLQDVHGLDLAGRVIVTATHSHHIHGRYWRLPDIFGAVGADTPDEEVIDLLATELALTVVAAIDDLGPAQWGWTRVDDWDPLDHVHSDRRHVNDFAYGKDPRLTVLAVRRPDGPPLAAVVNFGMHGTIMGSDNELLTEDAAGGLEMGVEDRYFAAHGEPIVAMFVQAGGGDSAPRGELLGHEGIARAEVIGQQAAPAVLEQLDALQWRDDAAIDVHSRRIDLDYAYFGYDRTDEFTGAPLGIPLPLPLPYTWGGWQCTSPAAPEDDDPATSMEGELKQCYPLDALLLGEVPNGEVHQSYLTVAKLGELFMVTVPGEPTHSVMHYLREQVALRGGGEAEVMGIGYAQDHLLYFTHPDDWFQGGYEAQMSLWGPFAARTLIDTQLEAVDAMQGGADMDAFVEQSPNLTTPGGFTPRAYEQSLDAGEILDDVPAEVMRTQTLRLRFGAGDPSIGSPRVVVQVDPGNGTFVDVPSPSGWQGAALDNSRQHMITHYDPDPPPSDAIATARRHQWFVDWEVPADLPAGSYRLLVHTTAWQGGAMVDVDASSSVFEVRQHDDATLALERNGDVLALRLQLPPVVAQSEGGWPTAGWRVHDPAAGPDDPITVRAPLRVRFEQDGAMLPGEHTVAFDASVGAHVFDLSDAGIDVSAGALRVAAHLDGDLVPDAIEADVP